MKFIKTMLTKKPGKINSNLSAPAIDYGSHYKPRRTMMALEPRIMFDGAAAATTADAVVDTKPPVQDTAAVDAAKLAQAVADVVPPAVQVDPVPQRTEIVFIENNVADYQTLVNDAKPGEEVHVLDSSQDGLAQMAQILDGRSGIDAIHIVSHGSEGALLLGSLTLTSQNLQDHAAELTTIGNALTQNADVLLYGCDVGAGSDGAAFVAALAQASQADIAASNDATGAAALGGNWQFETVSGSIETGIYLSDAGIAAYNYTLATFDFESATGTTTSTVTQLVSGVTMTATIDAGNWVVTGGGNYAGTSGNVMVDSATHTSETFSFSSAVDLTSFRLADQGIHNALVFTPTGGGNSVVNATETSAGATISLNWTGVTSFTVTKSGGGIFTDVMYDNFIFTQAGPTITSATYNASTNVLTVTGTGMTAGDTIDATKLTLTGEAGGTYALNGSYTVTASSTTQFSLTLADTDAMNVEGLLNYDGTVSVTSSTYNIAGAADWDTSRTTAADLTGNGVTVSNTQNPTITSSTYDANTGVLTVTGTNLVAKPGATNDITVNQLTLKGEGNTTRILTTSNVEVTSSTSFSVTLNAADKAAVNQFLNKAGTTSTGGTTYNLAAALGWNTNINDGNLQDLTNAVTVSNPDTPTITSSTYDATTGALVVTGTGFLKLNGAANDIVANKFTFTGEGGAGAAYTLTDSSNVEITSGTAFTITLSVTDKAAINQMINKNGTASTSGTTYNLAAAEDWTAGAAAGVTDADLTGNGITASNVAVPAITSSTYDATTGTLVVTGTGFLKLSGAANDIVANKFTFTGEGGATYTLTDSSNVEITSGTAFTITLSATDKAAINQILNKNGISSTSATTYNLAAAEDWTAGAAAGVTDADLTGNGITVSNVAVPAITSSTYDASTGALVVTGTGFLSKSGATNDIVANKFTFTGEGGATYTLTDSSNVEITSGTAFTITLSATDKAAINQILNKNGISSTSATTYNLAAAEDWTAGAAAGVTDADLTGNGITVSNVAVPAITSSTYDATTGALVVTGTGFLKLSGATNDIVANKFTFTGEGGTTYTLTDSSNVEITSGTAFTITLSATDKAAINQILNKNGISSTSATTYNLAAAEDWTAGAAAGVTDADLTGNGITVSNVAVPAITSSTYDANTGALVVTGTGFLKLNGAANDIVANKFTFTGEGGATYTLTDTSNVEITTGTAFTITLSATDKAAINQIINKNGTSSTSGTTYNLAAAEDWTAGAAAGVTDADLTGNGITVSNVAVPAITSSTYDATTGALVVTGTGFLSKSGATNDIVANKFTFTGEGGATYTLTDSSNVEITSGTAFTITLSATDKAAINQMINKNGTASTSGTTYNLAAAEDWTAGAAAGVTDADLTGNGITVSNVAVPAITSSTYDANTGALVVTGTGFLNLNGATNDIVANKFSFKGEGNATYTLTDTANVEITSGTAFTITLSATDKAAVNQFINKNGTSSTSGTTYNLAAAEDWTAGAAAGVTDADLTGNGITASNVAVPAITSSTYDANTGALVVTGTGFLSKSGLTNDIVANKFTFTGEGGATYTLTDTSNVEITSGTAFTITLSATDKAAINQMINKNGTSSTGATTYNLAAAEDWTAGAAAGVTDADLTGNGITVSNVAVPAITSATYDYNTNILVVTGTDFLSRSGATNDIDLTKLTFTGEGGATYTLTNATGVEITSATSFSVTLSGADLTNVEALLNKDGTSAVSTATYNLSAAASWNRGDATNGSDTTNAITVSNYAAPTVTSATYDASTNVLTVTGTNLVSKSGATNDVAVSLLTLTGEGGTYTLTSSNVEITDATTFSVTLNAADQIVVRGLLNKNGTSSSGSTTYNLAAAEDWMAGTAAATVVADLTGNGITVSNVQTPTITSSAYDSDTGVLTVTGTNLFSKVGANNDIDLTKLTFTGQGSGTYTLTNATGVEITSATSFTTTLTGADKTNVDALLNKIGTSANDSTTYNLAAADDWMAGADAAANIADATNAVTVSIAPKITSATYDATTGSLVVTGTNMQAKAGASNDITAAKLTFTGEGGVTYTLTDTADVELTSATSFTLALSATDKAAINQIVNKNGAASTGGTTYNLAAADDWDAQVTAGDTSDLTGNGITASNVAVPAITSSTYDATTGALVVTGTGFLKLNGATNDIVANKFTFTGEGGATYTLTDTSNVEITSGTAFTITLSATDKAAINQMINKNGTASTSGTTYNLAAAEDWTAGAAAGVTDADLTGNGITVSNVAVPAITSSTYDATTGALVVTGTGFLSKSGATNDIVANKFTFTGEGGATYTLTDTSNVEITSGTAFTITLSATDKAAINQMINKNGTASTSGTTYNLAAAEDWTAGAAAGVTDADLTGNGITVSNVAVPAITSSTYDATTGALVVTGTGFLSKSGLTNDIVANKFTFTGEGGATYTLTDTSNVEITSGTAFTITLSATDKAAINQMINKNGTSSTGATTYNLAAAEDWTAGAAAGVTDVDATNGITVSNVAVPAITSSTYDATTGALVVTGTGFLKLNGAANDIVANKFTFTGEGGATYTLTDTSNVEITSGTAFTITLSATDKAAINQIINKNGTSSTGATTYNLAAAEDWTAGAAAGVTDADLTGNGITASNVAVPTITSATYVNNTGVLVVTGANFLKLVGANNDIDASKLTFTGQGGATYTLTGTAGVEITSATEFTLTLTGADKAGVNALFNKTGLNANDNTVYNLAAAEDWAAGADAAVVVADLTNNGITVTANVPPTSINSSITVNEDASYTFVASDFNFSDVDAGNVLTQVQITALPSSGTLALNGTAVTANQAITKADIDAGKLTFRGAADAFGTANTSFQFKVHDGTEYSTTSYTETVNITAVNDAPSFTKGADQTVNEDAGAQTVGNWATGLSKGPANENGQTLSFTTSNNNNVLFSVQPTIDSNGNLTYTPAANANGTATVTVSIKDSGGTANGGVDTSTTQTFTITVNPVNDLPTGTVTISGIPSVGITLSAANTLADVDGLGTISYQWQANGIDITGATGSSYMLTDAEAGKTITVVARYTDAQGAAESVASVATDQVEALAPINLTQQTGNGDDKPSSNTGTGNNTNTNTGNNTGTGNNSGTGNSTGADRNNNASDTHGLENSGTNTNSFGDNSSGNNNSNSGSSPNQTIVVDMKLTVDSHGNGTSGGTINLPSSVFAGLNMSGTITITSTQSSGQSLPSFISVNPSTGAVTVKEGAVVTSPITVKVTIRDSQGKQVVVLVKVQPQKGRAQQQNQGQEGDQQPDNENNQQGAGRNQRSHVQQTDKQLAHAGKPGLTQQLQRVGSKGFELQRQTLLDSLASLVGENKDAA